MAIKDSPNARAIPTMPTCAPAKTAAPIPDKTRTKVPNSSAAYFIVLLSSFANVVPRVLQRYGLQRFRGDGYGKRGHSTCRPLVSQQFFAQRKISQEGSRTHEAQKGHGTNG